MVKATRGLISKKVTGMICGCGWGGETQAGYIRHDTCRCQFTGNRGPKRTVVDFPGLYSMSTIFVKKGAITEVPAGPRSGIKPTGRGR